MDIFSKGKAVKMPETLAELTALCPELIAQAKEEAIASIDVEGAKQEAVSTALASAGKTHEENTSRIFSIIGAALSEEISGKIKVIVDSGVTAQQYKSLGGNLIPTASTAEQAKKDELLAAITTAGADAVGRGDNAANAQNKDFNVLVAEYMATNQCTRSAAIKATVVAHPEAHEKYLASLKPSKKED
jgi:hypothetical protein